MFANFLFPNNFKRKKKKVLKEKNKIKEKIALKMELPNDTMDFHLQGDNEIFSLSKIKTKKVNISLLSYNYMHLKNMDF